ncbi:MAG TPA: CRISPR system precrRNA processing endoribonuclease RAMP protein Cas6 [Candidatus Choladousia intestinavium]|uniref:CRISPR system precrRNA processing endoribonuclease RAMP protein Cas6 n=1 Tax=Candidatus Choladousia intestinavium TaxID=2840727 RepID=A0A9D1AF51_9FIRM|nr:CRISPR system precrRNA processing endoribonuclease RAMP protein Cas6 [Candidatus Choladousia intestinavium]
MDFSGLIGTIEYEGDLTPFAPWLNAAQKLHIGRNTTFGLGEIQVYFV